ncbi:uncharacterized protein LOC144110880 [Amblyomma americanum]
MAPAVPPPQDATAVAALLDELWDHNCSLVTAIKHELSVNIVKEPVEETTVYGPPVVQGNLRKSGLYRCLATNENDEDMSYYMANIVQTAEQIVETERKTRGSERDFLQWKKMRACRISASSRPHNILKSRKERHVLAEEFLSERSFWSSATAYGNALEEEAIESFSKQIEAEVHKCGLVIMLEQPWLCCTPDAIVVQGPTASLLEVKCPYSCRDKPIVDFESNISGVPYLVFQDGKLELKRTHVYYTQVQVSMYVLGLEACFLYVYSKQQHITVKVPIDNAFIAQAVPQLENFYFKYFLPALTKEVMPTFR